MDVTYHDGIDIINKLAVELAKNEEILQFVQNELTVSDKHYVYVGMNQQEPLPNETHLPMINILGFHSDNTKEKNDRTISILYQWQRKQLEQDTTETNLYKYVGFEQIEKFRDLVEKKAREILKGFGKFYVESESLECVKYPMWQTASMITIMKHISSRGI